MTGEDPLLTRGRHTPREEKMSYGCHRIRESRRQRGVGVESRSGAVDDFAAFVHATAPQLYRTALLLTGDHHLAEDLTQATYARVFASWRRVQRAGNPVGYTRTTLVNTFLSHRRLRRSRERPAATADVSETLANRPDGPGSNVDADTRVDLLAALSELSPTDRAVLVARYWEDRSVAQTARDLELTESVVRARAKRALDRLRPLVRDLEGIL